MRESGVMRPRRSLRRGGSALRPRKASGRSGNQHIYTTKNAKTYYLGFGVLRKILFLQNGDGGSRTRVQKLRYLSVYACSLLIRVSCVNLPISGRPGH